MFKYKKMMRPILCGTATATVVMTHDVRQKPQVLEQYSALKRVHLLLGTPPISPQYSTLTKICTGWSY